MSKFLMTLLLLGFCGFGCRSSTDSTHAEANQSDDFSLPPGGFLLPPGGCLRPPQDVLQTNSFANIKALLPKVQEGMAQQDLLKTLGYPQLRHELNACEMFTYVERPGEFGTMKYVGIEISEGFVERVSEGEVSIDPW